MLWEDPTGQATLTVIVKGTFEIDALGGAARLASKQLEVLTTDEAYGNGHGRSVRFESDMAPFKPKADIVLVGRAHAPYSRPVTELDVTLKVGRLTKTLRVFGDRKWSFPSKLALIPEVVGPVPFETMELTYERAFGGINDESAHFSAENPVGCGLIGKKMQAAVHGRPLPNVEDPTNLIRSWDSRPRPVGLGFYGRGWIPRVRFAGTYDEAFQKQRDRALPADFSCHFFNAAHPDLQVEGYLQGDEEVELRHLTPEPHVRFQLPGIRPRIVVTKWTSPPDEWVEQNTSEDRVVGIDDVPTTDEPVPAVLDTLVLVPDDRIVYEVFRGVCRLGSLDSLEVARITVTD